MNAFKYGNQYGDANCSQFLQAILAHCLTYSYVFPFALSRPALAVSCRLLLSTLAVNNLQSLQLACECAHVCSLLNDYLALSLPQNALVVYFVLGGPVLSCFGLTSTCTPWQRHSADASCSFGIQDADGSQATI